jgi:hypothetical protein
VRRHKATCALNNAEIGLFSEQAAVLSKNLLAANRLQAFDEI